MTAKLTKPEIINLVANSNSFTLEIKRSIIGLIFNGMISDDTLEKLGVKILKKRENEDINLIRSLGNKYE